MTTATIERLECGHEESAHSEVTRGYAVDREGKRYCYDCALAMDRKAMHGAGIITGYLAGDGKAVTTWPGLALLRVTRTATGRHNMAGRITRVWAQDDRGGRWYGMGQGTGWIVTMRRLKG